MQEAWISNEYRRRLQKALNNILNDIRENPSEWVHSSHGFRSLVAERLTNEVIGLELQYERALEEDNRGTIESARLLYLNNSVIVDPSFCK